MVKKKKIVISAVKGIRSIVFINAMVRNMIKLQSRVNQKFVNFFSIHWPVSGVIKFSLPNGKKVKMFSRCDDFIATQVFWKGYKGYEGPSAEIFYYLSLKSQCIIDIGANVGFFSLIAGGANDSALIYAFEPVMKIYERLKTNTHINNYSNIISVNCAAGNSNDSVKFYIPKGKGIALAGSTKKGWAVETEEVMVPSITLDTYKKNSGILKIELIKLDSEFNEASVLSGMKGILKEDKPVILMEVLFPEGEGQKGHFELCVHLEVERIMKENGYFFYLISQDALIRVDRLEYNPDERNYVFSTRCTEKIYNSFKEIDKLIFQII